MLTDAFEEYDIDNLEYAFLLEKTHNNSGSLKMHVPKLMPLIARGTPVISNVVINNKIFVNGNDCKPITSTGMRTQNYLTVPRFSNTNFGHKVGDIYGYMYPDNKFIVSVMNKNIRDLYVTDSI